MVIRRRPHRTVQKATRPSLFGISLALLLRSGETDNGERSITHSFDTAAAWQNLALQATLRNLAVHAMEGFNYRQARIVLKIPADFAIEAMVAIGRPGKKENLPIGLQQRETPSDRRKLAEIITEGPWL